MFFPPAKHTKFEEWFLVCKHAAVTVSQSCLEAKDCIAGAALAQVDEMFLQSLYASNSSGSQSCVVCLSCDL